MKNRDLKDNQIEIMIIENWLKDAEEKTIAGSILDNNDKDMQIEIKKVDGILQLKLTLDRCGMSASTIHSWMKVENIDHVIYNQNNKTHLDPPYLTISKENVKKTLLFLQKKIPGCISSFKKAENKTTPKDDSQSLKYFFSSQPLTQGPEQQHPITPSSLLTKTDDQSKIDSWINAAENGVPLTGTIQDTHGENLKIEMKKNNNEILELKLTFSKWGMDFKVLMDSLKTNNIDYKAYNCNNNNPYTSYAPDPCLSISSKENIKETFKILLKKFPNFIDNFKLTGKEAIIKDNSLSNFFSSEQSPALSASKTLRLLTTFYDLNHPQTLLQPRQKRPNPSPTLATQTSSEEIDGSPSKRKKN